MVDFEAAEAAGMGIRARLTVDQAVVGLDFLLALGIQDSPDGAQRLAELLEAHHYTRGLGFVAQGTPTNNTQDAPSGYSSQDPGHEQSYLAERTAAETAPAAGSNAQVLAEALGLAESSGQTFANLPGATATEALEARDMNTALWQPTWGYFLLQMLWADPTVDSPLAGADISWARSHFIDFVRASGPLPAIRVGKQPYGILPVTSLDAWKPQPGQDGQGARAGKRSRCTICWCGCASLWRRHTSDAPRLGRSDGNDPANGIDKDIAEVLSMDGLSSSYAIRQRDGPAVPRTPHGVSGRRLLCGRVATQARGATPAHQPAHPQSASDRGVVGQPGTAGHRGPAGAGHYPKVEAGTRRVYAARRGPHRRAGSGRPKPVARAGLCRHAARRERPRRDPQPDDPAAAARHLALPVAAPCDAAGIHRRRVEFTHQPRPVAASASPRTGAGRVCAGSGRPGPRARPATAGDRDQRAGAGRDSRRSASTCSTSSPPANRARRPKPT